jgi:hypothetical protein
MVALAPLQFPLSNPTTSGRTSIVEPGLAARKGSLACLEEVEEQRLGQKPYEIRGHARDEILTARSLASKPLDCLAATGKPAEGVGYVRPGWIPARD